MGTLFNIAVSGTVTALLILLVKAVFRNKISAKINFAIWLILLIRLMVPVFPQSAWSFQNIMPVVQESSAALAENPDAQSPGTVQPPTQPGHLDDNKKESEVKKENTNTPQPLMQKVNRTVTIGGVEKEISVIQFLERAIVVVWAVGAITFMVYFIAVYLLFNRKIRAVKRCADTEVLRIFENCKEIAGIKKDIPVKVMENTRPMLKGFFHPVVILPMEYKQEALACIFTHELFHYKHKDNFFTILSLLVVCLNWYNPVMWVCRKTFQRDMELLCDQNVLEKINDKKMYANILLNQSISSARFCPLTTSMYNGKKEIIQRVSFIAKFKKTSGLTFAALLLCLAVVCMGCLTDSQKVSAGFKPPASLSGNMQSDGNMQGENFNWFLVPTVEADDIQPFPVDFPAGRFGYHPDFNYSKISVITRSDRNGGINYNGELVIPCEANIRIDEYGIVGEDGISYNENGMAEGVITPHGFTVFVYDITKKAVCSWDDNGKLYYHKDLSGWSEYMKENAAALNVIRTEEGNIPDTYDPDYQTDQYVYVSMDGKLLLETKFSYAMQFREGTAAAQINGKWGFIDASGKTVIPFVYDYAYNFIGGIAAVCRDGKWGYIDKNGNAYVELQFEEARPFYPQGDSKKAWVKKDGKWGIIEIKA